MNCKRLTPWSGRPYPLGATWDGEGVNFALFSQHAQCVYLCLFDEAAKKEIAQIPLPTKTDNVWHGYIRGLEPGAIYGYRIFGPYDPHRGHRFNPNKLLIDPYARALTGSFAWTDSHFGYIIGAPAGDLTFDSRNSADKTFKCQVIDPTFDWEDDRAPRTPWRDTIIYEAHVKGMTKLHPAVQPHLRGTYLGLVSSPVIKYLKQLGITALELMPVHAFLDERSLVDKGLSNYWGYNTINFFAPELRYACTDSVNEFKTMVKKLHAVGIEVILDVVYNHTAEGNHFGPTLSFKGIDNVAYYRLMFGNQRYYMDYTGCGNTLNMMNPQTLQLIMDSLRYWVVEMHVDGFRFDLAAALARESHAVDRLSAFFDIIHQDPILSQVKLIAEPWDLGEGGYQLGNFPIGWTEWNSQFRDNVRGFWRSDEGLAEKFSRRATGSSDLYQHGGRSPCASVNFLTCHDGFTLHDLVSYNSKHNDRNLDGNRDGDNNNLSWNCGEEGPSGDKRVLTLRSKQKHNLFASLLLSHGVPMICAGDEIGRTQQGNNNAYCQDNEISWINWDLTIENQNLFEFVKELVTLRKKHRIFRREQFTNCLNPLKGNPIHWYAANGHFMRDSDWHKSYIRCLGLTLLGHDLQEVDAKGKKLADDSFLLLINAHWESVPFIVPHGVTKLGWQVVFDTSKDRRDLRRQLVIPKETYLIKPRSLVLLTEKRMLLGTGASSQVQHPRHVLGSIIHEVLLHE